MQRNWNIYDKELFAVIHALETWRPYLVGNAHKTIINTNHNNLTYFKAARKLNQWQARWMQELAEFNFELRHVPGKKHIPTDFLSWPFGENQGKDDNEDLCYDTTCGLQLCLCFFFHVSPSSPRVACHPHAWPQRMTCDLASHDWQSGPLSCGACQCVSLRLIITVPSPMLMYGPLWLCQRVSELTDRDWVGP